LFRVVIVTSPALFVAVQKRFGISDSAVTILSPTVVAVSLDVTATSLILPPMWSPMIPEVVQVPPTT
jgi:hypothetical protein